jgi:hypothetical protein
MRERHYPRLCRSCDAPMARQEDSCWRCQAAWEDRSAGQSARLVVLAGHAARSDGGGQSSAPAITGGARAVAQATLAGHRLAGGRGSGGARSGTAQRSRAVGARVAAVR